MTATLIVRHTVSDYASWRLTYDSDAVVELKATHGCTDSEVLRQPDDGNDLTVLMRFPSVETAAAMASDPDLGAAMHRAGVVGAPRIELVESV